MKVLLVATVQSHIVQFHKPLVEMLHSHGCEVHVAARNNLGEKNGLALDFADKVFDLPFQRSPFSLKNITAYKKLKKIISGEHYDVIHCNTPVGGVLGRLAARSSRKKGTKVFYTAHGFHFYDGAPKINWLLWYPIEKYFAEHLTDKLITINLEDNALASERFACQVEHIFGVGVDETRFHPISEAEKADLREKMGFKDKRIILNVGELLPNKNQQMAIELMPKLLVHAPNAVLLIAGNGPEKSNLEKQIDALSLQNNVKLLGYTSNISDYLNISDVLIACSIREGLGLNVVEAMMSGVPVVATDNRGHRELLAGQRYNTLVPVNDSNAMCDRLKDLLAEKDIYDACVEDAYQRSVRYTSMSAKESLARIYEVNN